MEIPSQSFKFEKVKGKFHAEMNILGIAYKPDNAVGAKFSDTLKFDFDNKVQVEEFARQPVHYESQFDIATGQYNFRVVFSTGGDNFGKIEKPLVIEPFDGKQFAVSWHAGRSSSPIQLQANRFGRPVPGNLRARLNRGEASRGSGGDQNHRP